MTELFNRGLIDVQAIDYKANTHNIIDLCMWADVIVMQFGVLPDLIIHLNELIKSEKLPKLIVSEYDDDYLNISPNNGAYGLYGMKEVTLDNGKKVWENGKECDLFAGEKFSIKKNKFRVNRMKEGMEASDIITTTTQILANQFSDKNKNTYTLPNYINPDIMDGFKKFKRKRDYICIGWQGGDSHYDDLKAVLPVMKEIKKLYKNKVMFKFMGAAFNKMYKEVDGIFIPWCEPQNFYKCFYANIFDIGIIPLQYNQFNISKSNIKWLEYSYYKVPSVVSNVSPYKEGITNGVNGLLYNDNNEMFNHLKNLIDQPLKRAKMGYDAHVHVKNNYDIRKYAYKWYDLYKESLVNKIKLMEKEK
tara:strand:- start:5189 stop:6271 length:1083 start_codon:yes stop_codon:yes gene_type:complete